MESGQRKGSAEAGRVAGPLSRAGKGFAGKAEQSSRGSAPVGLWASGGLCVSLSLIAHGVFLGLAET